jgi:SAM-dependent methyltransferase
MSIIDLGGQPTIWKDVPEALEITILNLEGIAKIDAQSHHRIRYVVGDACRVSTFHDKQFDVVFSNSVIEHVGDPQKRAQFAHEAKRLGRAYWVQTPSKWFPIEAHCGMPFWWLYPRRLREWFIRRWRILLPEWAAMVEGTDIVTKAELRRLFPESTILVERVFGIPKSYIALSVPDCHRGQRS